MMIAPMIRRRLRREDLARLVAEIAETQPAEAYSAARALEAGDIDGLLDSPVALEAVRGRGGAPAPLPLTLLWYVPVRAALRARGESDVELADFTASLPLAFVSARANRGVARGAAGLDAWVQSIEALPRDTVARAERAAYCGALALWWAGVFPEFVARRGRGDGMIRAYVDFASTVWTRAGRALHRLAPSAARIYASAGDRAQVLREALYETGQDYVGPDAHSADARLDRYLTRLGDSTDE